MEVQNTFYDLQLTDGRNVKVTLNFARLYALRAKNRTAYDNYMKAKNDLEKSDDIDMCKIIYAAYLSANPDATEEFVEFLELIPPDSEIVGKLIGKLLIPSAQKKNFQQHSKKQRRKI